MHTTTRIADYVAAPQIKLNKIPTWITIRGMLTLTKDTMHNTSPTLMVYGCSFEQACVIASKHSLRNCEPLHRPVLGLSFQNDADLMAFKLAFGEDIEFEADVAIVFPHYQDLVEGYLSESGTDSRVFRYELLGMEFWDTNDLAVFDQALRSD